METTEITVTVADVLEGAATYIELYGWHQGSEFGDIDEKNTGFPTVCAVGGIWIAITGCWNRYPTPEEDREYLVAVKAFADHLAMYPDEENVDNYSVDMVGQWNDRFGMTASTVIKELRAAAARYRAEHASSQ